MGEISLSLFYCCVFKVLHLPVTGKTVCKPLAEIGEQILFWIGVRVSCGVWVYSDIWGSMNGRIRRWLGPEACWKTAGAEEWGENVMWASFCGWCKDSHTPPSPLQLLSRRKSLFIWWDAFQKFDEQDHINTFFFFYPGEGEWIWAYLQTEMDTIVGQKCDVQFCVLGGL